MKHSVPSPFGVHNIVSPVDSSGLNSAPSSQSDSDGADWRRKREAGKVGAGGGGAKKARTGKTSFNLCKSA